MKAVKNGTIFIDKDKIYVNYYVNITNDTYISIKEKIDTSDKGLSTGIIILIVVGSVIILIFIMMIIFIIVSKKKKLSNEDIEDNTQLLNSLGA